MFCAWRPPHHLPVSLVALWLAACGGGDAGSEPSLAPTAPAALVGDPVRGRALYQTICANCHAANPEDDRRGVRQASASAILFAVRNVNQMRFLRDTIGPQEAADLERWLADPRP